MHETRCSRGEACQQDRYFSWITQGRSVPRNYVANEKIVLNLSIYLNLDSYIQRRLIIQPLTQNCPVPSDSRSQSHRRQGASARYRPIKSERTGCSIRTTRPTRPDTCLKSDPVRSSPATLGPPRIRRNPVSSSKARSTTCAPRPPRPFHEPDSKTDILFCHIRLHHSGRLAEQVSTA